MGFQAILASFLQLYFFLIEVFQEFKVGGQIDRLYILVCRHLSGPLLRRALGNIPLLQGGGDRGPIARRGGGKVRDIIADTSGSPQGSPWTLLRWLPVTCRRHVSVVYRSPRSQRPHLFKNLSFLRIYLVPRSCLIAPCLQVPLQGCMHFAIQLY